MSIRSFITLFVVFFPCVSLFGQFPYYDSIKNNIQLKKGNEKLENYIAYLDNFKHISKDSFEKYQSLYELDLKTNQDEYYILYNIYFRLALLIKFNNYDEANKLFDSTLNTFSCNQKNYYIFNKLLIAHSSTKIRETKNKEAIEIAHSVLRNAIKYNDSNGYFVSLLNMGWSNMESSNTNEAIKYFQSIINTPSNEKYDKSKASAYSNLIACYGQLGKMDSARYCLERADKIVKENYLYFVEISLLNFKNNFALAEKKYKEVEVNHKRILELRKLLGDPFYYAADLVGISEYYATVNNTKKGLELANEALKVCEQNKLRAKLPNVYNAFYVNYLEMKDFKNANEYLYKYTQLKDSLYKETSAEALADLQIKFDLATKENTIIQQQVKLEHKNLLLKGSILLIMLSILSGYFAFRNLKHKKEKEKQLLLLQEQEKATKNIIEAEERERGRIAADLHDGVGQLLTAANMNLEAIDNNIASTEENSVAIEKAKSLVKQSATEIRNVSHNVSPNILLKSGFLGALKEFIYNVQSHSLKINLVTEGINEKLENTTETILYRIVQECVNNVIKHANANKLEIALYNNEKDVSISIQDNGRGFNPKNISKDSGIGLRNIKSRVEFLKGDLDIYSEPLTGTTISIHIPKTN